MGKRRYGRVLAAEIVRRKGDAASVSPSTTVPFVPVPASLYGYSTPRNRADPTRTRKLLAHRREIDRLVGLVERKGYTLVALSAYWNRGRAKLKIGIARGKKAHDKRASVKDRDWKRDQARILKSS